MITHIKMLKKFQQCHAHKVALLGEWKASLTEKNLGPQCMMKKVVKKVRNYFSTFLFAG